MTPWRHEAIALGLIGNLQGIVKFYCLNNGRILKCCLFTAIPMSDCIIKRVNAINACEKQGQEFCSLNRQLEPFEWTNLVPNDDPEFQGLLEKEEPVACSLPGHLG
jgi:hypothetical protein